MTKDNVIQFLHLASLYEFRLPDCESYIRANLDTCFENRDFLSLTQESVIALLSDETLKYVGSDAKFKFIMKWLRCRVLDHSDVGSELIQLIDLDEVSLDLIAEVQNDPVFQRCKVPVNNSSGRRLHRTHRSVLLMKVKYYDDNDDVLVYDLERSSWSRVTLEDTDTDNFDKDQSNTNAIVYEGTRVITMMDFDLETSTKSTFVNETDEELQTDFEIVGNFYNDGLMWSLIRYERHSSKLRDLLAKHNFRRTVLGLHRIHVPDRFAEKFNVTLYKGAVNTDGSKSKMTSVLTFPFDLGKHDICINESNSIVCLKIYEGEVQVYTYIHLTLICFLLTYLKISV